MAQTEAGPVEDLSNLSEEELNQKLWDLRTEYATLLERTRQRKAFITKLNQVPEMKDAFDEKEITFLHEELEELDVRLNEIIRQEIDIENHLESREIP